MNAQDLKNSILQLAIQGKLVEQREEEGTAKELLKKIASEKKQLIKEGKIKKQKALPEIKDDEIPFDIPESWEWVRLIDIGITQTGNTPSKTKMEYFGKFIPFISPGDILNGVINYENQGLSEQGKEVGRVSEKNSILQVCIGGSIGKCAINSVDVSYNQQINAITPLICNYLYVYYLMDSRFFLVSMTHKATGTATPIINKSSWESIIIPLPPLEEQKHIVAKIEELMPYVDQYDKAYSEVEELNKKFPEDMQKSILQYAIQGNLVEQREEDGTAEDLYKQIQEEKKKLIKEGKIKKTKALPEITEDEIPFDIPENWKWVRFQDVCAVLTCGYASTPKYVSKNEGMPFISAKNVKPYKFLPDEHNYISKELYEKLTKTCNPEKGDILLTRVGAGIGEAAIIDRDFPFAIYVSLTLIKLVNNELINNRYILYWLNSPIGVMTSLKNIFGKGASQGNLNVNNVRTFLVPLPPLEEQKRIVAKIEELLPYCDQLIK